MTVDTLFDMARRACSRHVRSINDIGTLPYSLVRQVLLKVDNPDQLYQLEQNCPQIIGEDSEIWLNMIKRDIPNWDTKPHQPQNPKNWYKVYKKLKVDAKLEMAAGEDKLKAALNSINATREQNTAQVVAISTLPRGNMSRKRQITYDYSSGRTGSKGAHKMSVLDKIKKDIRVSSSKKMTRPLDQLNVRRTVARPGEVIKQAPKNFVEDLKQQKQLARPPTAKYAASTTPRQTSSTQTGRSEYDLVQDREARLKALKAGKQAQSSGDDRSRAANGGYTGGSAANSGLSLGFLEDDELDAEEDLFGDSDSAKASPKPMTALSTTPSTLKRRRPTSSLFHGVKKRNVEVK